jgi:hypothetical protein
MISLSRFCLWLEQTSLSQAIQATSWMVPSVQTVHILAVATLLASALMMNLRLLGLVGRDQALERVSARFLPVIWWVLPVLLVTGAVMIIGEPARSLKNPLFQLKMGLLLAALALTAFYQIGLPRSRDRYDLAKCGRAAALLIALPSCVLWTTIVFCGRWIAYYLGGVRLCRCDRQPAVFRQGRRLCRQLFLPGQAHPAGSGCA